MKVVQSDFVVVLVCEKIYNVLFCVPIMPARDFQINPRLKELFYKQSIDIVMDVDRDDF